MRETDFFVVSDYRDTLILLPDTNLIKKQQQQHYFGARPELNHNLEETLQEL